MKDQRVEQWLNSFKLPWDYVEALPLAAIVIDKAAKENIRLTERLDEDLVVRYGVALQNGAEFPGIVVYATPDKRYGLLNGWHRTEAFRLAERVTIPAYVVKVADKTLITILRRTANTLEGKPPTMAEMIEHAVYMVRQGYTVTDAARLMSVGTKRLNDRVLTDQVATRLATLGVDMHELNVAPSSLARISGLHDAQLKGVVMLAHEARLGSERTLELARQLREAASDEKAEYILSEWRRTYAEEIQRSRGGMVRDPASAVRRLPAMMNRVQRALATNRDKTATLKPEEITHLILTCRRMIRELETMIAHLEETKAHAG